MKKYSSLYWVDNHPNIKKSLKTIYNKVRSCYYTIKYYSILAFTKRKFIRGNDLNLHLGSGLVRIPGWINVDAQITSSVDVADDVSKLRKFSDNCACSIYASHVLEHFSHKEIPLILQRWYNVLTPGGEIRISVPDMDRIVKIYYKNWEHFQTVPNTPWIGLIWGGQLDKYDFHKTGFNKCWLSYLLKGVGFIDIEEYPHEPHFLEIQDGSLAKEPFGDFISLNIKARKPFK